jgi:putative membrane protein
MKLKTAIILLVSMLLSAPAFSQSKPSDAQIAQIVVTANQIDVDAGKLAKSRSKNKEVLAFADQMITDHSAVNKQAAALVQKLRVKPEASATSKGLEAGAKQNMDRLKKAQGDEFDRAYIDHEVDYHQAVLDTIDKNLLPNAQNEELKDLISKVRPAIAAHLDHAKMIQSKLRG